MSERTQALTPLSDHWFALPVEGARLESCRIESSGKDGEVTLKVEGSVPVHFGMSREVVFSSTEGVTQRLVAIDDNWVAFLIEPADKPVRVVEARVGWRHYDPVEDELSELEEFLVVTEAKWELNVCFDIRLGFELEERFADV